MQSLIIITSLLAFAFGKPCGEYNLFINPIITNKTLSAHTNCLNQACKYTASLVWAFTDCAIMYFLHLNFLHITSH